MVSDTQILFGLIVMAIMGMITVIVGKLTEQYAKNLTGKQSVGVIVFVIIALVYWFWILFYWLNLYSESLE